MSVELEQSLTHECRTWSILILWMSNLINLGPMSVELEQSLTYECRTWSIFDLWVSNLIKRHSKHTRGIWRMWGEPPTCRTGEPAPPSWPIRFLSPNCKNPWSAAWLGNKMLLSYGTFHWYDCQDWTSDTISSRWRLHWLYTQASCTDKNKRDASSIIRLWSHKMSEQEQWVLGV